MIFYTAKCNHASTEFHYKKPIKQLLSISQNLICTGSPRAKPATTTPTSLHTDAYTLHLSASTKVLASAHTHIACKYSKNQIPAGKKEAHVARPYYAHLCALREYYTHTRRKKRWLSERVEAELITICRLLRRFLRGADCLCTYIYARARDKKTAFQARRSRPRATKTRPIRDQSVGVRETAPRAIM